MTNEQPTQLRSLEGRHVSVALKGGSRIDDSQLVSATTDATPRYGPLDQLIAMTEWALPPATDAEYRGTTDY